MEYEFRRDVITGSASAVFSYDHQVFGPWLEVEIGLNRDKLNQLLTDVEEVISGTKQEIVLSGREYSMTITADDVDLNANALLNTSSEIPEQLISGELNIDESSSASCGTEDFRQLLLSWAEFI